MYLECMLFTLFSKLLYFAVQIDRLASKGIFTLCIYHTLFSSSQCSAFLGLVYYPVSTIQCAALF